jgi:hypothetical protein
VPYTKVIPKTFPNINLTLKTVNENKGTINVSNKKKCVVMMDYQQHYSKAAQTTLVFLQVTFAINQWH